MGGFFMLFQLFVVRMGPLIFLRVCKERKRIKFFLILLILIYGVALAGSFLEIKMKTFWNAIWLMMISMFPHYLIYGFSAWLIIRCIWNAWSERVWNRIFALSIFLTTVGILCEKYINPSFVRFFLKILK